MNLKNKIVQKYIGVNKKFIYSKKILGFNKNLTFKKFLKKNLLCFKFDKILNILILLKIQKSPFFKKLFLSSITDESILKTRIATYINYLKKIKTYRGLRHIFYRPVRGQRTHTNAKTVRRGKPKRAVNKNISKKSLKAKK